ISPTAFTCSITAAHSQKGYPVTSLATRALLPHTLAVNQSASVGVSVIPGRCEAKQAASPESITADRCWGFRALGLRCAPAEPRNDNAFHSFADRRAQPNVNASLLTLTGEWRPILSLTGAQRIVRPRTWPVLSAWAQIKARLVDAEHHLVQRLAGTVFLIRV